MTRKKQLGVKKGKEGEDRQRKKERGRSRVNCTRPGFQGWKVYGAMIYAELGSKGKGRGEVGGSARGKKQSWGKKSSKSRNENDGMVGKG